MQRIDERVPGLKDKLRDVRQKWIADFYHRASGVAGFHAAKANLVFDGRNLIIRRGQDGNLVVYKADEQPLTQEQADELKQAVSNMEGGGYSAVLYDELSAMVLTGYTSARKILNLSIDFERGVPSYAMEALRQHVDEFAFLVNQREQDYLNDVIDDALATGATPGTLAANIKSAFEGGYHITDDQGNVVRTMPTDSWSETVARTELSRAQSLGNMALYRDAKIEKVLFATTQGANVCDICEPMDGRVYDIEDAPQPPIHSNCCCCLIAADEDVNLEAA